MRTNGVQPNTKCNETVITDRETRWRKDGTLVRVEDDSKSELSKPGGHSGSKQRMEASSLP